MLWNFIELVRRPAAQRDVLRHASEPALVESRKAPDSATAFDAWLQGYRKHLEEVCQLAGACRIHSSAR
jgi:hypothetical protein